MFTLYPDNCIMTGDIHYKGRSIVETFNLNDMRQSISISRSVAIFLNILNNSRERLTERVLILS